MRRAISQERLILSPPSTGTQQKPLAQLHYLSSSSPSPVGFGGPRGRGRAGSLDSPRPLIEPSRSPLRGAPQGVEKPKPTMFAPWAPAPYTGYGAPDQRWINWKKAICAVKLRWLLILDSFSFISVSFLKIIFQFIFFCSCLVHKSQFHSEHRSFSLAQSFPTWNVIFVTFTDISYAFSLRHLWFIRLCIVVDCFFFSDFSVVPCQP